MASEEQHRALGQGEEVLTDSITLNVTAEEFLEKLRELHAVMTDDEFFRVIIATSEAMTILKNRNQSRGPNGLEVIVEQNMRIELQNLALKLLQPKEAFGR
jgi:hypothetical protein